MMLTIHGLPRTTKYQDVKLLVKNECNISEFILDNLVTDTDSTKKIRIGLANETEGRMLMDRLDGFMVSGHVLRVQPFSKQPMSAPQSTPYNQPAFNQPRNDYPGQPDYGHGPHGRPMDHGPGPEWGPNNNQWAPNPQMAPNQMGSNHIEYSQGPMQNNPYMQQQPSHHQSPDMKPYGQGPFSNANQQPQGRILYDQTYHQSSKNAAPNMNQPQILLEPKSPSKRSALRSVEVIDTPLSRPPTNRYPPGQYPAPEKPITIMKDNFQGPSQHNVTQPPVEIQSSYKSPRKEQPSPWPQPNHHQKKSSPLSKPTPPYYKPYEGRNYPQTEKRLILKNAPGNVPYKYSAHERYRSPGRTNSQRISPNRRELPQRRTSPPERNISPGRYSPMERRVAPTGRQISPSGKRSSPSGRRISPPGKHISSAGRRISPSGRRVSPSRRGISPSGRRISPSGRHILPPGRLISPSGRRISPPGRRISPSGRRISPSGRGISPSGRRISPSGRRISPPGRRISPSDRRISPSARRVSPSGRRISPSGRRMSPSGRVSPHGRVMAPLGRIISSSGRRLSPNERRVSPSGRRFSPPVRRISPTERRVAHSPTPRAVHERPRRSPDAVDSASRQHDTRRIPHHRTPGRHEASPRRSRERPVRKPSPAIQDSAPRQHDMRYSPSRRHAVEKITEKYITSESRSSKQVRLEYEPAQVPNPYLSGYHPSLHKNVQYPILGLRQERNSWQDKVPFMKHDDERRDTRMFEPRPDHRMMDSTLETRRSPVRNSRSPIRRNRSPIRFKRHSPSPRSPRRSWALEKRRSSDVGDAPPPPVWPGQDRDENDLRSVRNIPEKVEVKHAPVWELLFDSQEQDRRERPDDRRFERDVGQQSRREPSPRGFKEERYREPKFEVEHHRTELQNKDFEHKAYERSEFHESKTNRPINYQFKPGSFLRGNGENLEEVHKRAQTLLKKEKQLQRKKVLLDKRSAARSELVDERRNERVKRSPERRERHEKPHRDKGTDLHRQDKPRPRETTFSRHEKFKKMGLDIKKRLTEYLTRKLIERNNEKFKLEKSRIRKRIRDEVKFSIFQLVDKVMRGPVELSTAKILSSYQVNFKYKESKIFDDVFSKFSKKLKRPAAESVDEVHAKIAKLSSADHVKEETKPDDAKKNQQPVQDQQIAAANVAEKKDVESRVNITQVRKPEQKPSDVPCVEPNADGLYEITARTTRLLDNELRHIMIKVWQELPDEPPTDEEQVVVDKFRNQAGDELRNVLGLNVTERLLNIHNPLHVKLIFSGKTEAAALKEFIERYNITAFKRLDKLINTYVAQLRTIADFDNICTTKDVRCGDVKVTVTPCYKFTQCPDKIKTNYAEKEEAAKIPAVEIKQETESKQTDKETELKIDAKTSTVATETYDNKKRSQIEEQLAQTENKIGNQILPQKAVLTQLPKKTASSKESDNSTNIQKEFSIIAKVAPSVTKMTPNTTKQAANAPKVTPNSSNNVPDSNKQSNTGKEINTPKVTSNAIKTTSNPTKITPNTPIVTSNAPKKVPDATKISNTEKQTLNASKEISSTADVTPNPTKVTPNPTKVTPNPTKVTPNPTKITPNPTKVAPNIKLTPNPTKITPNPTKVAPNIKLTPTHTKITPNPTKVAPNIKITPNPTKITPSTKITPTKTTLNTKITANVSKEVPKQKEDKLTTLNKSALRQVNKNNALKQETISIKQKLIFEEDIEMNEEDLEELNDEDILKLMSGAIVLDECIASDGE